MYLEALQYLRDHNEEIRTITLENAPKNCILTSHMIQKDTVECFAKEMVSCICLEIGDDMFSLLVDDCSDVVKKEQTVVVLSYKDKVMMEQAICVLVDDLKVKLSGMQEENDKHKRVSIRSSQLLEYENLLEYDGFKSSFFQLHHWLDLSLNYPVPSSLLILSRATLFSLHVDTVGVTSFPFEDTISERQRKLEKWEEEEEAKKKHLVKSSKDVALQEMTNAIVAYAPQQLCKVAISCRDLGARTGLPHIPDPRLARLETPYDCNNNVGGWVRRVGFIVNGVSNFLGGKGLIAYTDKYVPKVQIHEVLLESTESTLKEECLISVTTNVNEVCEVTNSEKAATEECAKDSEPQEYIIPSNSLAILTEHTSDSEKVKSKCKNLPIEEFESVSGVQIPVVEPKIEKSNLKEICINISYAF
ncbi:zinc finger MYM-type protein 1-like protein [Tanacetum coccineum]